MALSKSNIHQTQPKIWHTQDWGLRVGGCRVIGAFLWKGHADLRWKDTCWVETWRWAGKLCSLCLLNWCYQRMWSRNICLCKYLGRLWLYICELGVRHTKLLFSQTFLGLCEQSLLRQQNPSVHLPPLVWGWTALAADWTVYSRPPSRQHCCVAPPVGPWSAPRPDRIYIFPGKSGAYPGVLSPVGRAQNTSKIR